MNERLLPPISDDIIACWITHFNQAVYSAGNNPVIAACAVYGITIVKGNVSELTPDQVLFRVWKIDFMPWTFDPLLYVVKNVTSMNINYYIFLSICNLRVRMTWFSRS